VQVAFTLLKEIVRARRRVVRGEDDPEALHDYRVALRRIRSVTRALRSITLPAQAPRLERVLRRIARGTGPARDLEVLAAWVREAGERVPPGLGLVLGQELARERERTGGVLGEVLRTRVHAEVVDLFEGVFRKPEELLEGAPRPFSEVARQAALPLVTAAIAAAEALVASPGMAALHQLRISLKRVRYALEAFAGGWTPGVLRMRATLRRMQDQLGAVHDADVHAQWVVRAVVRAERRRLRDRQQGLDALEIGDLRRALASLAPDGALLEETDGLLALLGVERERAAKSALRLLQRRGLPGLEALREALEPPRPLSVRRVVGPLSPPAAVES
jgi:CHAD domain-containing protein